MFNRRNNFFISFEFNKCNTSSKLLYVFFFFFFVSHHNSKTRQKFDIFFFIEQNEISKQCFFLYLNVNEACSFTMFVEFTFSMFASCKSRWLMNVEKKNLLTIHFRCLIWDFHHQFHCWAAKRVIQCYSKELNESKWNWNALDELKRDWKILDELKKYWKILRELKWDWKILRELKKNWTILRELKWDLKFFDWLKWDSKFFDELIDSSLKKNFICWISLITTSFHTSYWTYVCCLKTNFFFLIRKTCLSISFIMKLFKSSISQNILWNSRKNAIFVQNMKFAD